MSRRCTNCNKGPKKAANRSHSKVKTLKTQKPNLQKDKKGNLTCSTCRRTDAKKTK